MADQPTTTTQKPETPKPYIPTIKDFEKWVEGRTGLTQNEFFDIWVSFYNLTPKEIEALRTQIKKEPTKPPTPKPTAPIPAPPQKQPEIKPTLIIERTPYPKWWKENLTAPINILGPATQVIVSGKADTRIWVATIALTVNGETEISFSFGTMGISGSMNFGGENQPMGMVIAMGNSPASCGTGGFSIYSSGDGISVGGFVTFFQESTKET